MNARAISSLSVALACALLTGCQSSGESAGARLTHVLDDGAGQQAGLAAGDLVVAVDGLQVNGSNLERRVARLVPGRVALVHAFRRDELIVFEVLPCQPPADTVYFEMRNGLDVDAERRLVDWLGND